MVRVNLVMGAEVTEGPPVPVTVKVQLPAVVPELPDPVKVLCPPVYYSGLGAITPLAMVTLRTRVDGQLMSVRYREGDTVHQGDLLVEIDDGPYQAALTQAEGQLIRDQAALENARID